MFKMIISYKYIYIYYDLYESYEYGHDDHEEGLRMSITKNNVHEKKKKKKKRMTTIARWQW